jgi:hypothetical protein
MARHFGSGRNLHEIGKSNSVPVLISSPTPRYILPRSPRMLVYEWSTLRPKTNRLNASCYYRAAEVVVSHTTPTIVGYRWSVIAACSRFAENKCDKLQS